MSRPVERIFVSLTLLVLLVASLQTGAFAQATPLAPNSIQVSRVQYDGNNGNAYVSPYGFPEIFNDPAGCNVENDICNIAGIQGSIFIDQFSSVPTSAAAGSLSLPSTGPVATYPTVEPGAYITTSFSSKSEGALMLSPGGNYLTYMGYEGNDQLDNVSNSYSPNPLYQLYPNTYTSSSGVPYPFYDREVALIGSGGLVSLTPIDNADSGDNPRAAITIDGGEFYTAGNSDSTETAVVQGGVTYNEPGLTIGARCGIPENSLSYQLGTYVATDRPDESAKKHIKDNNWRGIGIYTDGNGNQQLYVSKGSGSNGDDGLFQVGTSLPSCTAGGTDTNNTISELPGLAFPVTNQQTQAPTPILPFGFWFANPTTLYVADEGNPPSYTGGSSPSFQNSTNGTYVPSTDSYAGLEKWSLVNGAWVLDYTIQAGLNFNQPATFPGYNDINGAPIQSYTYGLRNMAGVNNGDGTVTIYAITSQFSAVSGGESDPTSLVGITDQLSATTLPVNEQFVTLQTSANQEVFRGVAYVPPAPGTLRQTQTITFPNPGTQTFGVSPIALTASATSGWPIAYTVISGPATVAGNVLTVTGAGTVVVEADQSGNTDYTAAASVQDTFTVSPEPTTVTWANPAPIIYGTPLSGAQLDATASVAGTFAYTPGSGTVLSAGIQTLSVTFTPTSSNYASSMGSVLLQVNQATPTVTWTNPAPITYGTALSGTQLDATASVGGSFVYTPGAGTVLNAGTQQLSVLFIPSDTTDYTNQTAGVSLLVNQASQTITFTTNAPSQETYGVSFIVAAKSTSGLPITYGSAGACTNSGATYTMTSGTGTCTVTASQPGNNNYIAATPVSESVTAVRANPTVTFTGAPTSAPLGTSFTLIATTNASGTAVITGTNPSICSLSGEFSPVTVTILGDSGSCKFTATWGADSNYLPAVATQITKAVKDPSVITWPTPAPITYGTTLSGTQLDATANYSGTFTYTPVSGTLLKAGNQTLKVKFAPSSPTDLPASDSVTLVVNKASSTTSVTGAPTQTVYENGNGIAGAVVSADVTSYMPAGLVTLTASTGEGCSGTVSPETGGGGCTIHFSTTGTRTVTATYNGDGNHLPSTSPNHITITVEPK